MPIKFNPPPPLPSDEDLDRWVSEGGNPGLEPLTVRVVLGLLERGALGTAKVDDVVFEHGTLDPVDRAQVLEVLDFLAAHVPGHPIATRRAAELAAAIRVRGLFASIGALPANG